MKRRVMLSILIFILLIGLVSATGEVERGGGLQITEVTAEIDGERHTNIGFNDNIDQAVKPGQRVTLEVEVSSLLAFNEIEDIVTTLRLDNIGGVTIEKDSNEFTLIRHGRNTIIYDLLVPIGAQQGMYKIEITAKGRDFKEHERHEVRYNLFLEVGKGTKELALIKTTLIPNAVSCGDEVVISNSIANRGLDTERNALLTVTSVPLDLFFEHPFEIKGGSIYRKSYLHEIPADAESGAYNIISVASFQNGPKRDISKLTIECEEEADDTEEEEVIVQILKAPMKTSESRHTESNGTGYFVLLLLLLIVITVILIMIIALVL